MEKKSPNNNPIQSMTANHARICVIITISERIDSARVCGIYQFRKSILKKIFRTHICVLSESRPFFSADPDADPGTGFPLCIFLYSEPLVNHASITIRTAVSLFELLRLCFGLLSAPAVPVLVLAS